MPPPRHRYKMNFTGKILIVLTILSFASHLDFWFYIVSLSCRFVQKLSGLVEKEKLDFIIFLLKNMLRKCDVCCSRKLV